MRKRRKRNMGCGTWTTSSYLNYSTSKGRTVTDKGVLAGNYSAQDLYTSKRLQKELNPLNAMRVLRHRGTSKHNSGNPCSRCYGKYGGRSGTDCKKA